MATISRPVRVLIVDDADESRAILRRALGFDDAIDVDDWEDRRKTAVHEVGHSVGLGHDTISAMKQGEIPDSSLTWRTFSADDITHINDEY